MTGKKSQKGADGIVLKRKIYQQLLEWKEKRAGEVALLVEGARRIGKSYVVEEFAKNEYESYILIDFNKAPQMVRDWFDLYLEDLDTLFLYLSQHYKVRLHERKSLIILDEKYREVMFFTSPFLICLEFIGKYHVTHTAIPQLASLQRMCSN